MYLVQSYLCIKMTYVIFEPFLIFIQYDSILDEFYSTTTNSNHGMFAQIHIKKLECLVCQQQENQY